MKNNVGLRKISSCITILLCLMLVLSGCSNSGNDDNPKEPDVAITDTPTAEPTVEPTEAPTAVPTETPKLEPTEAPTPIIEPTEEPTDDIYMSKTVGDLQGRIITASDLKYIVDNYFYIFDVDLYLAEYNQGFECYFKDGVIYAMSEMYYP